MKFVKLISKFMLLIASVVVMVFSTSQSVDAFYNAENDKITGYKVDRPDNKLTISVQYQLGLNDLVVYVCPKTTTEQTCMENPTSKFIDSTLSKTIDRDGKDVDLFVINKGNGDEVLTHTMEFNSATVGKQLDEYQDEIDSTGKVDATYTIMATALFCEVRTAQHDGCNTWSEVRTIVNEQFSLNKGLTSSGDLNKSLVKFLNITNNIIIPVLWLVLAVLLIVRGILLGIDIVKLADEPEARKNKINGLVWLIIGVVAGYAITIAASFVMSSLGFGGYF